MGLRYAVFVGALLATTGLTGTGIYFLRQAAAETDQTRQSAEAETACVGRVQAAIDELVKRDSSQGATIQVTGSASHYNRRLNQCLVEVSTFEHQETPNYVKSLIDTNVNSAILWSFSGDGAGTTRECFSSDAKKVDCAEADQKWKTFMSE